MAQPIVSPENLNQAVEEIKEYIDGLNFTSTTYIYTVISKRDITGRNKQRIYLAIDPSIDVAQCSLLVARRSVISDTVWINGEKKRKKRHCSWHQIWAIPQNQKKPLIDKMILKTEPWCEYNGKLLYEITWEGYDSLWEWLNEADPEVTDTGYRTLSEEDCNWDNDLQETICSDQEIIPITYADMLSHHKNGIALVKDGKIISNYARFGVSWIENNESYMLYR